MRILLTGGTGLIGRHFIAQYRQHQYTVLTRSVVQAKRTLGNEVDLLDSLERLTHLDEFDAVVNLAGEPIIDRRWTGRQKEMICRSRWDITQRLVDLIRTSHHPPSVFISGSAIGIYGDCADQTVDEQRAIAVSDFPSLVCEEWEKIALKAASEQTRVALLRTGIVLAKDGGALAKMLLPFRFNLGGRIGNGQQYMSWIHLRDMVRAIHFILHNSGCQGALNMTAPEPVTNAEFSQTLAHVLNRIAVLPVPSLALKVALGEAAKLLLDSQRIVPQKLNDSDFEFDYPKLDSALNDLLSSNP